MRVPTVPAALVGLLVGVLLAVVLGRGDDPRPGDVRGSGAAAVEVDEPLLPPDADGSMDRVSFVEGTEQRRSLGADPAGGAPWVVRGYLARRVQGPRTFRPHPPSTDRCVQVGRRLEGRAFGWVGDGARDVGPVGAAGYEAPTTCRDVASRQAAPTIFATTTVVRTAGGAIRPGGTVVYGMLGRPASEITVLDRGRPVPVTRRVGRGFAGLAAGHPHPRDVRVRVRYRDGTRTDHRVSGTVDPVPPPGAAPQGLPGTAVIGVRTPDPDGGLPWGILIARTPTGAWCAGSPFRVLGAHVGYLGAQSGTFTANSPRCGLPPPVSREAAVEVAASSTPALAAENGQRLERRTLPGRTVVSGRVHPDVRSVEIATPRDVRMLVPERRTGAFLALYDGELVGSTVDVTARFADGTTRAISTPVR